MNCDETVDWNNISVSTSADDVQMEHHTWKFLKGICNRVMSGDIDAYLEAIERMRPIDDLLEYGSRFEFGTDHSDTMEVEFRINAENMMPDKESVGEDTYKQLLEEYVYGSSIRVARDLFALLPVKYVVVYANLEDETIFTVKFDSELMQKIDYKGETSKEIVGKFKNVMKF